jgi:competence protein ComEC
VTRGAAPRRSRTTGDAVVRPSISPLLWVGAATWLGSLLGSRLTVAWWAGGGWLPLAAGWGCAALAAGAVWWKRRTAVALLAGALALGLVSALLHGAWLATSADAAEKAGPRDWTGVVIADAKASALGTTVAVRLDGGCASGATVILNWPKSEPVPAYGTALAFSSRLRAADRAQEWARAAFQRGEAIRGSPWRVRAAGWAPPPLGWAAAWRASVLERLRALGGSGAAVLSSMLLGAKGEVAGSPVEEDAKAAGVAWALSASGLHLAVAVLLAERAAGLAGLSRLGRASVALAVLGLFVLAAGVKIALVRAALVAAIALVSRCVGRRRDATAAVGLVVAMLVTLDPPAALDAGLLLGVLAVTGIVVFGGLAREWLSPLVGRSLGRALAGSTAAQLSVAPLSASLFGSVGLLGPLALLLSGPLVTGAVGIGLVGALLVPVSSTLADPCLRVAAAVAAAAAFVWKVAAGLPGAVVPMEAVPWWAWAGWLAAGGLAWMRWPVPRRSARVRMAGIGVAALIALATIVPPAGGPQVVVMDVGQGDAILVRDGSHSMLVDTGPDPTALRRALARAGVRSIDGLVLTHAHDDHTGGLAGLAGVARPAWIGIPDVVDAAVTRLGEDCLRRAGSVVRLKRDMAWTVGETRVRVLWPQGGERRLEANDTSVILLLERGAERVLLLGDAEERAQRGALEAFAARVDVLKVAHHGSPNGSVPEALETWSAPLALISVGAGNRFGHPSRVALEALAATGATVRRTDLEGDLTVRLDIAEEPRAAANASFGEGRVCDNPACPSTAGAAPRSSATETEPWPPAILPILSRSTSSSEARSSCSSARSGGSGTVSPRSLTSTSTWRSSRPSRPPPTTSSTRRTRCRS